MNFLRIFGHGEACQNRSVPNLVGKPFLDPMVSLIRVLSDGLRGRVFCAVYIRHRQRCKCCDFRPVSTRPDGKENEKQVDGSP
jgi:hypothetical protein